MSSSPQENVIAGGYEPVDPKSPKIQELAAWAVNAYNEKNGTRLLYVDACKAELQVVNGMNYMIWLEATNGGIRDKYIAKVYENKTMVELVDFVEANEPVAVAN